MDNYKCPLCDSEVEFSKNQFICKKCGCKSVSVQTGDDPKKIYDHWHSTKSRLTPDSLSELMRYFRGFSTLPNNSNYTYNNGDDLLPSQDTSNELEPVRFDNEDFFSNSFSPESIKKITEHSNYLRTEFNGDNFLKEILSSEKITIIYKKEFSDSIAEYGDFNEIKNEIFPELRKSIELTIKKPYKHQIQAFKQIIKGENVIISTPTSSGKTESFMWPIFQHYLEHPETTSKTILIYPTKALTENQYQKFCKFRESLHAKIRINRLDGDNTLDNGNTRDGRHGMDRDQIMDSNPQIILTNLTYLHTHMFGNTEFDDKFKEFIQNLKFLVVDEVHKFTDTYGSNAREVFLRLKRLSSSFQVICTSATLEGTEPEEFAKKLFSLDDLSLIQGKGKRGKIILYMLYPRNLTQTNTKIGNHPSKISESDLISDIFVKLVRNGHKTLAFSNSRYGSEEIYIKSKSMFDKSHIQNDHYGCVIHRAGLLITDRESAEKEFTQEKNFGMIATPTMELGIDIGDVDAVVSEFAPYSTITQRIGRAGRGSQHTSYGFIILNDKDPISRYYLENPEKYFTEKLEFSIDDDNEIIKKIHTIYKAHDMPLTSEEIKMDKIAKFFKEEGILRKQAYSDDYDVTPEISKKLLHNFSIMDIGASVEILHDDKKIGDWDLPMAFEKLHPKAVYLHKGQSYRVKDFDSSDSNNLKCYVDLEKDAALRTLPNLRKIPQMDKSIDKKQFSNIEIELGYININKKIKTYREFHRNLNPSNPLARTQIKFIKDFDMLFPTVGIKLDFKNLEQKFTDYADYLDNKKESYHTLEHLLIHSGNMLTGGIYGSIDGITLPEENTIFLYDKSVNGGNGACKRLYEIIDEAFKRAITILNECSCSDGCPLCTHSYLCRKSNKELNKKSTLNMLEIINNHFKPPTNIDLNPDIMLHVSEDLTKKVIPSGEDKFNEFKEFYQYDDVIDNLPVSIPADKKPKVIEEKKQNVRKRFAIAISSFGNDSDGGFVYLGISSDGTIVGLDRDKRVGNFADYDDKFANHIHDTLETLLKDRVFIISKLKIQFTERNGKTICIIQISPSSEPLFIHSDNTKEFYVRGPAPRAEHLDGKEMVKFIKQRFPNYT